MHKYSACCNIIILQPVHEATTCNAMAILCTLKPHYEIMLATLLVLYVWVNFKEGNFQG